MVMGEGTRGWRMEAGAADVHACVGGCARAHVCTWTCV